MNISTLCKRAAMLGVLAVAGLVANAQTFVYDGVIYKASGANLTAQKAGTAVTVGEAGPTAYTGDIVIPETIEYNGKTYKVTSIGGVFKDSQITSIIIGNNVTTISKGCFSGCTELAKVKLPAGLVTFNGNLFENCTALEEISIPGTVKEVSSNQFKGTTNLKKITFEEGATGIDISSNAFTNDGLSNLETLVFNRAFGDKFTDISTKPFRGLKNLKNVEIGGTLVNIPTSTFENCTGLKNVTFNSAVTAMGTNVFAGSGVEEIVMPETLKEISASTFQGCKSLKKVTISSATTLISDMAFYNSTIAEINIPTTLTRIGQMAFAGGKLSGALELPAVLATVGLQAFANNNGLTSVSIPATVSTIGDGAFMGCTGIAKYEVAADNAKYAGNDKNNMIITKVADGEKPILVAYAAASAETALEGNFAQLKPYAVYGAKNIVKINLPDCENWGDYSVAGTSIAELAVKGTVGRYVASNCAELAKLTISGSEVPFGIAANDAKLVEVIFTEDVTTVKQDAFLNCTALKSLKLGKLLAILETDCFKGCAVDAIEVCASIPASMADGVIAEGNNITVTVPVDLVDAYKAASGWKLTKIAGDANLAAGPSAMGMPAGLYYAGTDNMLHCVYEKGGNDTYDVGGVPHTFQLAQFKNRIYGASAGVKFVYSATGAVDGDGKLFYISQIGGKVFQAVVLDNAGNNAYKDPFGVAIFGDILYVNDRNVCIRKIPADALALPQDYPSWVENNWLGYYGSPWSYGCIKSGWAITSEENAKGDLEPVYWVGMKYNGNGIFTWKDEHIGTASAAGTKPEKMAYLCDMNPIFTTFYIDEANDHMYIYLEKGGVNEATLTRGGLYRIELSKLKATPEPQTLADIDAVLIDGSPVKWEGSGANEHVGISQLSPDENGEYLYWCYRAPADAAEAAKTEDVDFTTMTSTGYRYWWADKYDAENPLHKSGIKRIKLGVDKPEVEMVAPGVEGYGCVPVNYVGSKQPDAVMDVVAPAAQANLTVNGNVIVANEAAVVYVYNMSGSVVAYADLAAGESMSIADLENGAYVATANGAALKFVK